LKAEALTELKKYKLGPLYTPPTMQGTLMRPGLNGGANWGGGAFDPETGMLYVKSTNVHALLKILKVGEKTEDVDQDYTQTRSTNTDFHNGIPLLKPPYAHLTAIDLNKGEIAWRVPFGDDARLRAHPALAGVKLPEKLGAAGSSGAVLTKSGLLFVAGGGNILYAVNAANGEDLWKWDMGRRTNSTPMTYRTAGGKQLVVVASGVGKDARVTAFAVE
jgi:quinoprotein glucose dehydrogenase